MSSLSAAGAAFIRRHEGFKPRRYLDPVGIPTIGIGFTMRSAAFRQWWAVNRRGAPFGPGASMTTAEADAVLKHLVAAEYGAAVEAFLGPRVAVAQHVFDAMASVVFNCGAGALRWKWAAAAKAGDYARAAELLKTTAITAGGKRLRGLVNRRAAEARLLAFADYGI
jgi:GH24 family phage-related lysozyme (muramidase)